MSAPMTAAQWMTALAKWKVDVVYLAGWKARGRPDSTAGGALRPNGIMIHHTGSDSQSQSYIDWLFKTGRPAEGIPGPLANAMSMMDGRLIMGATGKANHAGKGVQRILDKVIAETVSLTSEEKPGSTGTVNGNPRFYGNEVAFDGGQPMTAKQYETTVRWCAAICDFHGWTSQSIIGHGEWTTAKWDPGMTDMAKLRRDVNALLAAGPGTTPAPKPTPEPEPSKDASWTVPSSFKLGATGPDVTRLGQRLVVWAKHLGLPAPYKVGPGPLFTETDRKAVGAFQRAQGWSGGDADGYPGSQSLAILASDPPKPAPGKQAVTVLTLNLGSRNAAVNKKYGSWSKRVVKAAAFIIDTNADFVCLQETYAAQRPALDKLLAGKYQRLATRGGRVMYWRVGLKAEAIGGHIWTDLLPGTGTKYAVARKFRFPSGAVLNLANAHLSYETSSVGVKKRAKEVPAFVAWVRRKFPTGYDLYVGDFNSPFKSTTRRDDVGPIFARYNLHDFGYDVNAKAGKGNYHLDRAFGGLVKATRIRVLPNSFTDHPGTVITAAVPTK